MLDDFFCSAAGTDVNGMNYYAYCPSCGYELHHVDKNKSYQCPVCRGADDEKGGPHCRFMRIEKTGETK